MECRCVFDNVCKMVEMMCVEIQFEIYESKKSPQTEKVSKYCANVILSVIEGW